MTTSNQLLALDFLAELKAESSVAITESIYVRCVNKVINRIFTEFRKGSYKVANRIFVEMKGEILLADDNGDLILELKPIDGGVVPRLVKTLPKNAEISALPDSVSKSTISSAHTNKLVSSHSYRFNIKGIDEQVDAKIKADHDALIEEARENKWLITFSDSGNYRIHYGLTKDVLKKEFAFLDLGKCPNVGKITKRALQASLNEINKSHYKHIGAELNDSDIYVSNDGFIDGHMGISLAMAQYLTKTDPNGRQANRLLNKLVKVQGWVNVSEDKANPRFCHVKGEALVTEHLYDDNGNKLWAGIKLYGLKSVVKGMQVIGKTKPFISIKYSRAPKMATLGLEGCNLILNGVMKTIQEDLRLRIQTADSRSVEEMLGEFDEEAALLYKTAAALGVGRKSLEALGFARILSKAKLEFRASKLVEWKLKGSKSCSVKPWIGKEIKNQFDPEYQTMFDEAKPYLLNDRDMVYPAFINKEGNMVVVSKETIAAINKALGGLDCDGDNINLVKVSETKYPLYTKHLCVAYRYPIDEAVYFEVLDFSNYEWVTYPSLSLRGRSGAVEGDGYDLALSGKDAADLNKAYRAKLMAAKPFAFNDADWVDQSIGNEGQGVQPTFYADGKLKAKVGDKWVDVDSHPITIGEATNTMYMVKGAYNAGVIPSDIMPLAEYYIGLILSDILDASLVGKGECYNWMTGERISYQEASNRCAGMKIWIRQGKFAIPALSKHRLSAKELERMNAGDSKITTFNCDQLELLGETLTLIADYIKRVQARFNQACVDSCQKEYLPAWQASGKYFNDLYNQLGTATKVLGKPLWAHEGKYTDVLTKIEAKRWHQLCRTRSERISFAFEYFRGSIYNKFNRCGQDEHFVWSILALLSLQIDNMPEVQVAEAVLDANGKPVFNDGGYQFIKAMHESAIVFTSHESNRRLKSDWKGNWWVEPIVSNNKLNDPITGKKADWFDRLIGVQYDPNFKEHSPIAHKRTVEAIEAIVKEYDLEYDLNLTDEELDDIAIESLEEAAPEGASSEGEKDSISEAAEKLIELKKAQAAPELIKQAEKEFGLLLSSQPMTALDAQLLGGDTEVAPNIDDMQTEEANADSVKDETAKIALMEVRHIIHLKRKMEYSNNIDEVESILDARMRLLDLLEKNSSLSADELIELMNELEAHVDQSDVIFGSFRTKSEIDEIIAQHFFEALREKETAKVITEAVVKPKPQAKPEKHVVFLSGSRSITSLPKEVMDKLDELIAQDVWFVVGDCYGADVAFQTFLYMRKYNKVGVFYAGKKPRNSTKGFALRHHPGTQVTKDIAMTAAATCGLVVWDGSSKGSRANAGRLKKQNKAFELFDLSKGGWVK